MLKRVVVGRGHFTVRNTSPTDGRNPKTGDKIECQKKLPFWKTGRITCDVDGLV